MLIPDITKKRARLTPDKVAFEDLHSGKSRTYLQLEVRAEQLAAWLLKLNVISGDRVAILCRNRIEFFETLFACAKIGAILVPLNWRMPLAEIRPVYKDSGANIFLHGIEDFKIAQALVLSNDFLINFDAGNFEAELANQETITTKEYWSGSDIWYLLYTSGTTGEPKAVIQNFQMALVNAINIGQAINISSNDRTLNFLPLFHTGGINLHTLPTLMNGGLVKLLEGFDVDKVCEILSNGEIDTFFAVPAVYRAISEHPTFKTLNLSRVRSFGCGGAAMPDVLIQKFSEQGASVCNGMGMTETGPTLFLMDKDNTQKKIGSVGKPQILSDVRIVDEKRKLVLAGESGELEVFGSGITPGYFNNPTATASAFTKDGWLKTGDIAYQDLDGYYFIAGRSKDMFISGGENVYPAEVENVLSLHPAILEAVVIGVADEKWGEVGQAYLILRENFNLNLKEIEEFCTASLAKYKIPKSFIEVKDFPRTAAGKVRKHLLKVE